MVVSRHKFVGLVPCGDGCVDVKSKKSESREKLAYTKFGDKRSRSGEKTVYL